jgi:hypothetical protein
MKLDLSELKELNNNRLQETANKLKTVFQDMLQMYVKKTIYEGD